MAEGKSQLDPKKMEPVDLTVTFGKFSVGKETVSVSVTFPKRAMSLTKSDKIFTKKRLHVELRNWDVNQKELFPDEKRVEVAAIAEFGNLSVGADTLSGTLNFDLSAVPHDDMCRLAQESGTLRVTDSQNIFEKEKDKPHPDVEDGKDAGGTPALAFVAAECRQVPLADLKDEDGKPICTEKKLEALKAAEYETWGDLRELLDQTGNQQAAIDTLSAIDGIGATFAAKLLLFVNAVVIAAATESKKGAKEEFGRPHCAACGSGKPIGETCSACGESVGEVFTTDDNVKPDGDYKKTSCEFVEAAEGETHRVRVIIVQDEYDRWKYGHEAKGQTDSDTWTYLPSLSCTSEGGRADALRAGANEAITELKNAYETPPADLIRKLAEWRDKQTD